MLTVVGGIAQEIRACRAEPVCCNLQTAEFTATRSKKQHASAALEAIRLGTRMSNYRQIKDLREPHLHIRALFQVDALDETDLSGSQRHDHGGRARAFAEKADALHQRAVGDAGGGEDE